MPGDSPGSSQLFPSWIQQPLQICTHKQGPQIPKDNTHFSCGSPSIGSHWSSNSLIASGSGVFLKYFRRQARIKLLRKPPELIIWFFRRCLFYMISAECWGHEEIDGWYVLGCDPHLSQARQHWCPQCSFLADWYLGPSRVGAQMLRTNQSHFWRTLYLQLQQNQIHQTGRRVQLSLSHPGGRLGRLN